MNYCSECTNRLIYPLEQREKLCSTHLFLFGYEDKMMITNRGYLIPKPEHLPLSAYYPFVWRFAVMLATATVGVLFSYIL